MQITPTQFYYLLTISPPEEQVYDSSVVKCIVEAVSKEIPAPVYSVGDTVLSLNGSWIPVLFEKEVLVKVLVNESAIVALLSP